MKHFGAQRGLVSYIVRTIHEKKLELKLRTLSSYYMI